MYINVIKLNTPSGDGVDDGGWVGSRSKYNNNILLSAPSIKT